MSSPLAFTKLEALGNDFVLIDARQRNLKLTPDTVRALADRRHGIGCDQVLVLAPARDADCLLAVKVYNADGSPAEQCGNGLRAIGLWLLERGEISETTRLFTDGGKVRVGPGDNGQILVELPPPDFRPAAWGYIGDSPDQLMVDLGDRPRPAAGVSIGNPHLVVEVDHPVSADEVLAAGKFAASEPRLNNGANIGLARVMARDHVDLKVCERGAGPTPACGSGACAAASLLIRAGRINSPASIEQPGGTLVIHWPGGSQPITMTGPARLIFEGNLGWPNLRP